jgi:hypothetical protein
VRRGWEEVAAACYRTAVLPAPYEQWFVALAGEASPTEPRATCEDCAMAPGAPDLPPEGPFDPALRCCTFHPRLAPHFVGAILDGGSAEGRARVLARIAARGGVSPLGLAAPPHEQPERDRLAQVPGAFGHAAALRCPFLAEGRGTIWAQRGAECAAFHCKHDHGAYGPRLWTLLITGFNVVERGLARTLLAAHGLDAGACDALLHAPLDPAADARAWGAFRGREADYFLSAWRWVSALSWEEVEALSGGELQGFAQTVRGALEWLRARPLPAKVARNPVVLVHLGRSGARLQSPAVPLDLLPLPQGAAARLESFVEGPPEALGLEPALLRKVLLWQGLVPMEPESG